MYGHSLTQLDRVISKSRSAKTLTINAIRTRRSPAAPGSDPNHPSSAETRLKIGHAIVRGKDHTPRATRRRKVPVSMEGNDERRALASVPGSDKALISKEIIEKFRPDRGRVRRSEKRVGNTPRSVGISHHKVGSDC